MEFYNYRIYHDTTDDTWFDEFEVCQQCSENGYPYDPAGSSYPEGNVRNRLPSWVGQAIGEDPSGWNTATQVPQNPVLFQDYQISVVATLGDREYSDTIKINYKTVDPCPFIYRVDVESNQ